MSQAQEAQKKYYDKQHIPQEFAVDDYVLLSTKNLALPGSSKLQARFVGPFRVLARAGDQSYKLQLPPSLRQHQPVFHTSLLRRAPSPPTTPLPPLSDDTYEVERIVVERKTQYRARWLGYNASEDSWIPKDELAETAPEVVATWETTAATQRGQALRS